MVRLFGLVLIYAPFVFGGTKVHRSDGRISHLIHSTEGPEYISAYFSLLQWFRMRKRHGPAAGTLKAKVPDPTVSAKNNAGQFPIARVRKVIIGDDVVASHGSREMPIWSQFSIRLNQTWTREKCRFEKS